MNVEGSFSAIACADLIHWLRTASKRYLEREGTMSELFDEKVEIRDNVVDQNVITSLDAATADIELGGSGQDGDLVLSVREWCVCSGLVLEATGGGGF